MSEFELQQLFIATRWEFDLPTILFVIVSLGFVAVGTRPPTPIGKPGLHLMQLAYVFVSGFFFVRMQAAIGRAAKLTELIAALKPSFQIGNPAFQQPTTLFRYGTFVVLFVVTLLLLQRATTASTQRSN